MPLAAILLAICVNTKQSDNIPRLEKYDNTIVVSFSQIRLTLYDSRMKEIKSYPVAIPKKSVKIVVPARGEVASIILNPFWYPTANIRKHMLRDGIVLPDFIGPGDPSNPMGKAKIIIRFDGGVNRFSRIHGTHIDSLIGKRVSLGCIRMHNEDIIELIKIIRGKKTRVIFEN